MKALRDVFGDTLVSLAGTNKNVVVLDADLANSTKADKFAKAYPDRFLQMGIAEQNFVGVGVGLGVAASVALDLAGRGALAASGCLWPLPHAAANSRVSPQTRAMRFITRWVPPRRGRRPGPPG